VRIRNLAIAFGAAVALGAAVVPVAARGAAADAVTITSVTNPSPGVLAVSVTSDTSLTSLDVTLTSAANPDALSFTIADFTLSGTDTAGTYTLTSPITDAQLPAFDTYTVDVSAGDSGSGTATDSSATMPWLLQPSITLTASSTTFSYDFPSITFSGTLSLTDPDGSAADPSLLANQTLLLTNSQNRNDAVTTSAGGAYSIVLSRPDSGAYFAQYQATATTSAAQSPPVTVTASQYQTEVTASVSATQLNSGQSLTISGTAEYDPGTQFVPLANSVVQIYSGPATSEPGPLATVTTDAQGNYTYTFADQAPGTFYVYAGGVPGNTFLDKVLAQAVAQTVKVNVALPLTISGLQASLSPFAVLTLKGCLIAGNGQLPPALTLRVESASKAAGPWKTLSTVHGLGSTTCGTAPAKGLPFDYHVQVPVASAYYRLAYAGSVNFEPAVSKVVHEAKTLTKITNFAISPRSVATGKYVTVSGRLWRYSKGWHPFARQKIWILARYKGKWYFYNHKPLTSSAGRFSGRFKVYFSGPWLAEFTGSATYFASASNRLTVTARTAAAVPALGAAGVGAAGLRPEAAAGAVLADTGLRLAS
jgi:hypothetical protein